MKSKIYKIQKNIFRVATFIVCFCLLSTVLFASSIDFIIGDKNIQFGSYQWYLKNYGNFHVKKDLLENNTKVFEFSKDLVKDYFIHSKDVYNEDDYIKAKKGVDINYDKAYDLFLNTSEKSDVIVAVLDTGIDISHEDLLDSIWTNKGEIPNNNIDDDNNGYVDDVFGYNFYNNNNQIVTNVIDDVHGTCSAGIIVAKHRENGIRGIAYSEHVKVMPLKILGVNEEGSNESLYNAIKYARDNGASICNISLGSFTYVKEIADIIKDSDMLFVVASGNGVDNIGFSIDNYKLYPASLGFDNVICVSNLCFDGNICKSSNYGEVVDISAPGSFIISTITNNRYGFLTGSSFSAPVVSGICAMMLSLNKDINKKDIKSILKKTSIKVDDFIHANSCSGYVDAYSALKECLKNSK